MIPKVRKAVFPAAGLGTRFLPATKAQPKEMLPLVDKPLIQYGVEEALHSGIKNILIVTGRGKSSIEDHFDVSFELEQTLESKGKTDLLAIVRGVSDMIDVSYIRQKEALGLGHAVLCARELVGDEPFAVILPDDVIDAKTPCLKQMIDVFDERGGSVPSNLAIIGRYVLTPEIFASIEAIDPGSGGEIQLTDALKHLLRNRPIYGYKFEGKRYDAGDKLGFLKATVEFALNRHDLGAPFLEYLRSLKL